MTSAALKLEQTHGHANRTKAQADDDEQAAVGARHWRAGSRGFAVSRSSILFDRFGILVGYRPCFATYREAGCCGCLHGNPVTASGTAEAQWTECRSQRGARLPKKGEGTAKSLDLV